MVKMRSNPFVPIILLIILVLIFFGKLVFSNLVIARGDTFLFFFPYWEAASEALRNGQLPIWNDRLFMGAPLLANSQVGFFYPLNWPIWLLFETPKAISASIVLHILIASIGAFLLGRRSFQLDIIASLIVAVTFSLGAYLGSQVEHLNQLQGMAWLPWFFVLQCSWMKKDFTWSRLLVYTAAFAILLSFQLLAGHFQTVFITASALIIWIIAIVIGLARRITDRDEPDGRSSADGFKEINFLITPFVGGLLLAVLMSAAQLLPTLELISQSTRQGGLPPTEVLSFSLHPLLLAKSLLLPFETPIFSEYVAGLPAAALLLAVIGIGIGQKSAGRSLAILLVFTGLLLALGAFNPIYHLLARLPIFNLFRAPARWLVLYALGVALLAGIGWHNVSRLVNKLSDPSDAIRAKRQLGIGVGLVILLIVWGITSAQMSKFFPIAQEAPVQSPQLISLLGWALELMLAAALILLAIWRNSFTWVIVLGLFLLLSLYTGTRQLPYNNPTTPEAYSDLRPPIARLKAQEICGPGRSCSLPQGRVLGMSEIFFDVGDQDEIDTIYQNQLSEKSQFDYTVAMKHKEVVSPNLPLAFGLSTVDGFDGGLLPLDNFSEITRLVLEAGTSTTDGRLREFMIQIPEERWLDLFNVRYLITDKVEDQWRNGVFFDLQNPTVVSTDHGPVEIGFLPDFEATEIWLISPNKPGLAEVATSEGRSWKISPERIEGDLYRYVLPEPGIASSISLIPCGHRIDPPHECTVGWTASGLSLADSRDDTFHLLVLGQYRLIHSGDVKIYDNLDVLPRAFMVYEWIYVDNIDDTLNLMHQPDFDPSSTGVIMGEGSDRALLHGVGEVVIDSYEPGALSLSVMTDVPGLLVLTDSFYPGWSATIDDEPAEILQADVNFRGLLISEGDHQVNFVYKSGIIKLGITLSFFGILFFVSLLGTALVFIRKS